MPHSTPLGAPAIHRYDPRHVLRALLDQAPLAILVVDHELRVREASRAATGLIGRPRVRLRGSTLPAALRDPLAALLARARHGEMAEAELEVEAECDDGALRLCVRLIPVRSCLGVVHATALLFTEAGEQGGLRGDPDAPPFSTR